MRFFKTANKTESWLAFALHADGIAVVGVARTAGTLPTIQECAFYPGTVEPELLHHARRELGAASYHCTTVLAAGEYQLLTLEAPNVTPDELKTAVRWRLKDMLDFHVDDATIDVLKLPIDKESATRSSQSMFAVAARNSVIERRQSLFANGKVGLAVIDIPEIAQRNISALLEQRGRGLAMLSFDGDGGLLTVSYNAELYLSRRIDVTPEQLGDTDAVRRTSYFDKVTLELQRSLDHVERQFHFISVSKLVLAPLATGGLQEYLAANLYTPVEQLVLSSVVDLGRFPGLLEPLQQQRFLSAIGAALRHEEKTL